MQRSGGNNGNIYDLRKDLHRPQEKKKKKETSGSTWRVIRHLHRKRRPPAALTAAMALMVSR